MPSFLIDVRTPEEYAEHHAAGAVNIPMEEIFDGKLGVLADTKKDTPLCLYCRSGNRSERAKEMLSSLGYTDIRNLGGVEDAQRFSIE
ncbi:MAG: rhodanese-like domain-containing protein [Candidatus Moraniibacteriota bacterium]